MCSCNTDGNIRVLRRQERPPQQAPQQTSGTVFEAGKENVTFNHDAEWHNHSFAFKLAGTTLQQGDTVEVTVSGTPTASTTTFFQDIYDTNADWANLTEGNESEELELTAGIPFSHTFTLTITQPVAANCNPYFSLGVQEQEYITTFGMNGIRYSWKNLTNGQGGDNKSASLQYIDDEWGKRFLNDYPLQGLSLTTDETVKITLSGTPDRDFRVQEIQIFERAADGNWDSFGNAKGKNTVLSKGAAFTQEFFITPWKDPQKAKNLNVGITITCPDGDTELAVRDFTIRWEKVDARVLDSRLNDEGKRVFSCDVPATTFAAQSGDRIQVTVSGTPSENAVLHGISFHDLVNDDWIDFGGVWDVDVPVQKDVPFEKRFIFEVSKATSKNSAPKIYMEFFDTNGAEELHISNFNATWEPTSAFDSTYTIPLVDDEWGKRYQLFLPLKGIAFKKGQKITVTLTGTLDGTPKPEMQLYNTNQNEWQEATDSATSETAMQRNKRTTVQLTLPATAAVTGKDSVTAQIIFWHTDGMPQELTVTDFDLTYKVTK